jgi:hypothetical protein
MSEPRRIIAVAPNDGHRPRFAVGGQATQAASGDVKVYEWRKERGDVGLTGLQTDVGSLRVPSSRDVLISRP